MIIIKYVFFVCYCCCCCYYYYCIALKMLFIIVEVVVVLLIYKHADLLMFKMRISLFFACIVIKVKAFFFLFFHLSLWCIQDTNYLGPFYMKTDISVRRDNSVERHIGYSYNRNSLTDISVSI